MRKGVKKADGADYIGAGPIFKTPIKGKVLPKGIALLKAIKKLGMPLFAIGGIDRKNITRLAHSGFRNAAVIRAVCQAQDVHKAARRLKGALI